MVSHRLLCALLAASLLSIDGYSQASNPEPPAPNPVRPEQILSCGCGPKPVRIAVRHIEANGVGYNQGYSTMEAFFSPYEPLGGEWLPFVDVRGHVFNNGRLAANAGIGLRYLSSSRVWGINTYYDYRNTRHHSYYQAAVGLESLGETWDFRLNGYLPFGSKKSPYYDLQFDHFKGNYAILSQKREFAMKGLNAEVGAHVQPLTNFPVYFAAGPYYLTGEKSAWGGEGRMAIDCGDYVRLEGSTSYDHLFKWTGQGQLSLILPLGRKREVKPSCNSCCGMLALSQRAVQRVDRSEIIPIDHKRTQLLAIDPTTGLPYFFLFVNNLSHSAGTFESPFSTLAAAQIASKPGDIIYVFEGDGTTAGMDHGFVMKPNQRFWSSGVDQQLPTKPRPMLITATSGLPQVTNVDGDDHIIQLANGCEVSGFHIIYSNSGSANVYGIYGDQITDAWVLNNQIDFTIDNGTFTNVAGVYINQSQGIVTILNNAVSVGQNNGTIGALFGISGTSSSAGNNVSWWWIRQNSSSLSVRGTISDSIYGIAVNTNSAGNNNSKGLIRQNDCQLSIVGGTITNDIYGIYAESSALDNNSSELRLEQNLSSITQSLGTVSGTAYGIIAFSDATIGDNTSNLAVNQNSSFFVQSGGAMSDVYGVYAYSEAAANNSSQLDINQNSSSFQQFNGAAGYVTAVIAQSNSSVENNNSQVIVDQNETFLASSGGSATDFYGIYAYPYGDDINQSQLEVANNTCYIPEETSVTGTVYGMFAQYPASSENISQLAFDQNMCSIPNPTRPAYGFLITCLHSNGSLGLNLLYNDTYPAPMVVQSNGMQLNIINNVGNYPSVTIE